MRGLVVGALLVIPIWVLRPARAEEPLETLTREQVVQQALACHPAIVSAEARVTQAQARLASARRWFRPQLSVSAGERFETARHRFGIQVSHDLDALWDRTAVRQAAAELTVAEQALALTRQTTVADAAAAYDAWILARLGQQRAARRLTRAQEAVAHGRTQYDDGLIAVSHLRELEKAVEEAEDATAETSARLYQAALKLRQAMGALGAP